MRRIFDLGLYIARRKLSQLNNFAAGLKIERGEVFFADGYENRDEREREREGGSCATKNMVSVNEHVGERYERREKNMIHLRRCGECGAGRRERVAK